MPAAGATQALRLFCNSKLATILAIILTLTPAAFADWYCCKVSKAGPKNDGKVYISLNDLAASEGWSGDRWFTVSDSEMKDQVLAVALAAMSQGLTLRVALSSVDQYTTISAIYLYPAESPCTD